MTKPDGETTRKPRRMAREPKPDDTDVPVSAPNDSVTGLADHASPAAAPPAPVTKLEKAASKASLVLDMLRRPEGATLDQMVAATCWLPHTTRAVLTSFKKRGHTVASEKADGVRIYWVGRAAPAEVADAAKAMTEG